MLRTSAPCACLVINCQSVIFLQMSNIHFILHGNHWALEISNIFFSPLLGDHTLLPLWKTKSCLSSPFSFIQFQELPFTFCSLLGLSAILQSLYWLILKLIMTHYCLVCWWLRCLFQSQDTQQDDNNGNRFECAK